MTSPARVTLFVGPQGPVPVSLHDGDRRSLLEREFERMWPDNELVDSSPESRLQAFVDRMKRIFIR